MKRLVAGLLCALAGQATATAHGLDEYMQAAQLALAPGGLRIELRMIPGVQVADRIFAPIDHDGDGQISPLEEQAYARGVLHSLALKVDSRSVPLALNRAQFPSRRELNEGSGVIRLDLAAQVPLGTSGEHRLCFRNDYLPAISVYLANVLVPTSDTIKITGQQRDPLQHELQVDFHVLPAGARTWPRWMGVLLSGLRRPH